ncbi:aminotransferase class V-fold PLP-dependent enzyme [Vibrio sp. TRT 21S02]|uniref:aminotransferase class V-fold PLP-dependent enzyme n=1 Tax=Vibrio sp. TRT 21S02 TaxID=3418507 RepID=UPI003CFA0A69
MSPNNWRRDFPTLSQEVYGLPLVYLDSAATAQTPNQVIERMQRFYQYEYANVHRGVHALSANATTMMEHSRAVIAAFLNAPATENLVFTKGTTEAINLIAHSFLFSQCQPGDEIIITEMEHHSNIVPWQIIANQLSIHIKVWPVTTNGELDLDQLRTLFTSRTKLLTMAHVSNVLGSINDVKNATELAHQHDIAVFIDGAQAVVHQQVDVQEIGCDFYAFSGHKLYGPTGVGVLYIGGKWLNTLPPWEGGGAMIDDVQLPGGTTFLQAPWRFEAGTPNIAGILGLEAAIHYLNGIGFEPISSHDQSITDYAVDTLSKVESLVIYGNPRHRTGMVSFNLGHYHPFDVGSFLDRYGIAIRTGHLCSQPLMRALGTSAVCRASFGLYTTQQDVDLLADKLKHIKQLLG